MKDFRRRALPVALALLLPLAACGRQPADTASTTANAPDAVYVNGAIYTVDDANTWADAMAVKDGRITAIGRTDDISKLRGAQTQVVDLGGRMVMPGINDQHAHPMQAGLAHFFECSFPFSLTMDQMLDKVRACVAQAPKGTWIRGGQWGRELLATSRPPNRTILDAISTDHPIFLGDSTVHDAWVNSKALELLGIAKGTPNPHGGVIDRDANGEPTGILHDNATFFSMQKLPAYTADQYAQALEWAMGQMNAVGVTSIRDALVDSYALRAYHSLDQAGRLHMKVGTALAWKGSWSESHDKELDNIAHRGEYRTANIDTDFAKIFLDGIPPSRTAAMLDPYLPDTEHGKNFRGELIHSPEELKQDLVTLDKEGITVKIHATGDRAVRVALDAFEAARKANGMSDRRHEVAHAELISAQDVPRFKALNVTAEMCPILWYHSPLVAVMAQTLGDEKANHFWPTRTMVDSGALVSYGSDWPSVVPDPSPWPGIESLVTRRDPYTNAGEQLWGEQAVDLPTAVRIFTRNGAVAARRGDAIGTLAVGKTADFIVLDRNIFKVPIEQVSDTKVLSTVVDGKEIYKAK